MPGKRLAPHGSELALDAAETIDHVMTRLDEIGAELRSAIELIGVARAELQAVEAKHGKAAVAKGRQKLIEANSIIDESVDALADQRRFVDQVTEDDG